MGNAGYGNHTEETKKDIDSKRLDKQRTGEASPAAGPHDKPSLTNPDSTPGAGALPDPGARNGTDSTSG